jgi:hypothetical protein
MVLTPSLIEFGATYYGQLAGQPRVADIFGHERLARMNLLRRSGSEAKLVCKGATPIGRRKLQEAGGGTRQLFTDRCMNLGNSVVILAFLDRNS